MEASADYVQFVEELLRALLTVRHASVEVAPEFKRLKYKLALADALFDLCRHSVSASLDALALFSAVEEDVEAQIQASLSGIEDDDFLGFLDTHFELTRFKADRKKIPALFAKWQNQLRCATISCAVRQLF
eukprot:g7037.t1